MTSESIKESGQFNESAESLKQHAQNFRTASPTSFVSDTSYDHLMSKIFRFKGYYLFKNGQL